MDTKIHKVKELLTDLKGQKKGNEFEEKRMAKLQYYKEAAHLNSVNTALSYVIAEIERIIHGIEKF